MSISYKNYINRTSAIRDILKKIGVKELYFNVKTSNLSSFKVGGICSCLVVPDSLDRLKKIMEVCLKNKIRFEIIGEGTNILINDGFLDIVIIKLGKNFNYLKLNKQNSQNIEVGAAYKLPRLIKKLCAWDYDLSFLTGIPGTIGGAVAGNSGDNRTGICNFVSKVGGLFGRDSAIEYKEIEIDERYFEYRFFNIPELLVITVVFLKPGKIDKDVIIEKIKHKIRERKRKQPLYSKTSGCFFKNPTSVSQSAGMLIENCGLKGFIYGGAKISEKHANFIENYKSASACDIISLSKIAKGMVAQNFNINLEPEVSLIGF